LQIETSQNHNKMLIVLLYNEFLKYSDINKNKMLKQPKI